MNLTFTFLDSSTVNSIEFSVLVTEPLQSTKVHSEDGTAVNRIILPELYSVVVLPDDIISSVTVPSP